MTSPGATAVSSTSVPMRNWARLTGTELPAFPPSAEGKGGGGGDDFAIGMIAQAVKNGIQASRKRAARRCIGSESNKEQTQCHGGKWATPHGRPEAARGVQPGLRGFDGETPSCAGLCGGRTRVNQPSCCAFSILAQESRNATVRLKTSWPAAESGSTQK